MPTSAAQLERAPTPGCQAESSPNVTLCCLFCDYDLSGLPDGRCPECGTDFTRQGLLELLHRERERWLDVPPGVLAALGSLASIAALVVSAWNRSRLYVDTKQHCLTISAVLFAVAWLVSRRRLSRGVGLADLWIALPAIVVAKALHLASSPAEALVSIGGFSLYLIPIALVVRSCRRCVIATSTIAAVAIAWHGARMIILAVTPLLRHKPWAVPNPTFEFGPYATYISRTTALCWGIALIAAAVMLAFFIRFCIRMKPLRSPFTPASSPPPSSSPCPPG